MRGCSYEEGTIVTLHLPFYGVTIVDGEPVTSPMSPDTVTVKVEKGDDTVVTVGAAELFEGIWEALIPTAGGGTGKWRWTVETTGTPTISSSGSFMVTPQLVP